MLPDRHALPASQRAAGYLPWVFHFAARLQAQEGTLSIATRHARLGDTSGPQHTRPPLFWGSMAQEMSAPTAIPGTAWLFGLVEARGFRP